MITCSGLFIRYPYFLWFINGSEELSKPAREAIEDTKEFKYIIIVSFWEISIKLSLNKLDLKVPFRELQIQAIKSGFEILPLTFDHSLKVAASQMSRG